MGKVHEGVHDEDRVGGVGGRDPAAWGQPKGGARWEPPTEPSGRPQQFPRQKRSVVRSKCEFEKNGTGFRKWENGGNGWVLPEKIIIIIIIMSPKIL
jgi:hypothetical protein